MPSRIPWWLLNLKHCVALHTSSARCSDLATRARALFPEDLRALNNCGGAEMGFRTSPARRSS